MDSGSPASDASPPRSPRVFISYSHDSEAHKLRVRALADRLRADGGCDAWIDQYENDDPGMRWPAWMRRELTKADKILVVFTPDYRRRFEEAEDLAGGKGGKWEGAIITQQIYDSGGKQDRIRVVLLPGPDGRHDDSCVSDDVKGFTHYRPEEPLGWEALVRWLHGIKLVQPAPIRPLQFQPPAAAAPVSVGPVPSPARPPAPPAAPPTQPAAPGLPALYTAARARLRVACRSIPVFGRLRPDIPMADNFINLRLTRRFDEEAERVRSRHHLDYHDPERRDRETDATARSLPAAELWQTYTGGCILGLPGAGKTTILRHFAHLVLEPGPEAALFFLECRRLEPRHFGLGEHTAFLRSRLPALDAIVRYLAHAALDFARRDLAAEGEPAAEPTAADITRLAQHFTAAWTAGRGVVLIDALDETTHPNVRDAVVACLETLLHSLPGARLPPGGTSSRVFLTARRNELEHLADLQHPVFEVEPLDQEQMRTFARHLFGEDSPVYRRFDDQVWREPVLQKMGRTPITALLLLCYFEYYEEFDVRYRTYDLLVRFSLLTVWEEIKAGGFRRHDRAGLAAFFREAAQADFDQRHPTLRLRYDALAPFCFDCLYESRTGAPARDFDERALHDHLTQFLGAGGSPDTTPGQLAAAWIGELARAHLLIRTGAHRWVFVHSTVMEFLAARHLLHRSGDEAVVVAAAAPPPPEHASAFATLETLPLACGGPDNATLFAALERHFDATLPRLTLLVRALAEVETAESRELGRQATRKGLAAAEQRLEPARAHRAWAYALLAGHLRMADATALEHWQRHAASELPLTCDVLPAMQFGPWWRGEEDLPSVTVSCLEKLLHPDVLRRRAADRRPLAVGEPEGDPVLRHYRRYVRATVGEADPRPVGRGLVRFLGDPRFQHGAGINALAVHPREPWVVTGGDDGVLRLWDLTTGLELRAFTGHTNSVLACAFSPDGARVLSGSGDKTLRLWEAGTGRELRAFPGHTASVRACAFSPDGARVLSGSDDKTLRLWEAGTGRELRAFPGHTDWVRACAFSPDGARVLSGSWDNTLRLWEAGTGRELRALTGHTNSVLACAFSPDGARVLSGSGDKTLRLWEAGTGRELRAFPGHTASVRACAFSPDGARVLSGSDDKTLRLWEAGTGRELRAFPGHTDWVRACAFSPDGARVLSGSWDNTLRLWEAGTGRELRALTGHTGSVLACAFSPDGARVLSGSGDNTLRLWGAGTGRELRACTGHTGSVQACAFSPDGARVLSGSDDKTLRLWEAGTGRELRRWIFPWQIFGVSWSPRAPSLVAVAGGNGTVTLLDVDAEP